MKNILETIAELEKKSKSRKVALSKEASLPEKKQSVKIPKSKLGTIAAPNALFRSALFPALNSNGSRLRLIKEELFSVGGLQVLFDGEQFDQVDLDVYLAILNVAKDYEIGSSFEFSAYQILKMLKITTNGERYKWFKDVMFRLKASIIIIKDHRHSYHGNLIEDYTFDADLNKYVAKININYAALFNRGLWSTINIEQRLAIGRNQTAKSLHAYYSTHTNPMPHKIETLANITGLKNKNKRMIPVTIIKAHEVLCSENVDFLESYTVDAGKIATVIKEK